MKEFLSVFDYAIGLFKTEFTIYGLTFSYWELFVIAVVSAVALKIIRAVFS